MELNSMKQTGGEGSTNIQAQTVNVLPSLTEDRVHEIFAAELYKINTLQQEARLVFEKRLSKFESVLLDFQKNVDNSFSAYGEPSFLYQLQNTMKVASQTDGLLDHTLLSNLLCKLSLTPLDKYTKARVFKATEIANMISTEALSALTACYAYTEYFYIDGKSTIQLILEKYNALYENIIKICPFPKDNDWVSYAEMLAAVQRQPFRVSDLIDDIIKAYPGYFVVGVEKESDLHKSVLEKLHDKPYKDLFLVAHELHPGFLRLPVAVKHGCAQLIKEFYCGKEILEEKFIDDLLLLYEIYDMISGEKDKSQLNAVKNNFLEKWESFSCLKEFRDWYLNSNNDIYFTPAGSLLCEAYLQCLDIQYPEVREKFFSK